MKNAILVALASLLMVPAAQAIELQDLDKVQSFENFTTEEMLDFSDLEDTLMEAEMGINNHGHRRPVKCVARNRRGIRFIGEAPRVPMAQRRAMRKCRNASMRPGTCRIIRCRQARRPGHGPHGNDNLDTFIDIINIIGDLANK
ncbi:MAG: hypothetical protein KDD33_06335 [Bdellovibrionales bacterium]|nr:hypothetical protein [Bdellovibrionales bacterium]